MTGGESSVVCDGPGTPAGCSDIAIDFVIPSGGSVTTNTGRVITIGSNMQVSAGMYCGDMCKNLGYGGKASVNYSQGTTSYTGYFFTNNFAGEDVSSCVADGNPGCSYHVTLKNLDDNTEAYVHSGSVSYLTSDDGNGNFTSIPSPMDGDSRRGKLFGRCNVLSLVFGYE